MTTITQFLQTICNYQMVSWIQGGLFGEFARTIYVGLDCLKSWMTSFFRTPKDRALSSGSWVRSCQFLLQFEVWTCAGRWPGEVQGQAEVSSRSSVSSRTWGDYTGYIPLVTGGHLKPSFLNSYAEVKRIKYCYRYMIIVIGKHTRQAPKHFDARLGLAVSWHLSPRDA